YFLLEVEVLTFYFVFPAVTRLRVFLHRASSVSDLVMSSSVTCFSPFFLHGTLVLLYSLPNASAPLFGWGTLIRGRLVIVPLILYFKVSLFLENCLPSPEYLVLLTLGSCGGTREIWDSAMPLL